MTVGFGKYTAQNTW